MELLAYASLVETKILFEMEERLYNEVMKYIVFLIDHTEFTAIEMKLNNQTFHW